MKTCHLDTEDYGCSYGTGWTFDQWKIGVFEFTVDMVPPKLHKNSNTYPFKVNNNFVIIDQLSIKKQLV